MSENNHDWREDEPLWRRLNPCDIGRYPWLAPVGDFFASLTTECPCCTGARIVIALLFGLGLGTWLL